MSEEMPVEELQDLGDLQMKIRRLDDVRASGVEPLVPNDDSSFGESTGGFRDVLDEHFSERLDELAGEGEQVVVERLVAPSDDVPYIEYTLVEDYGSE